MASQDDDFLFDLEQMDTAGEEALEREAKRNAIRTPILEAIDKIETAEKNLGSRI